MRRLWPILLAAALVGCEAFDLTPGGKTDTPPPVAKKPDPPKREPRLRPKADVPPAVESYAVCAFDLLTVSRAERHSIDQLFTWTEAGGVFGPDEKVLALNGLRIARTDLRFREPFAKALEAARQGSKMKTLVRLPEGREQVFDVGEALKDVSLFVWTSPDAVLGRHFSQARYSLTLRLEKVAGAVRGSAGGADPGTPALAEYGLSWRIHTGAAFQRTVTIPTLDLHAELAAGQALLIAPTGTAGRSVDRALLSGMDESTVKVTCVAITLTEVRAKPAPKEAPAESPGVEGADEGETPR